MNAILLCGFLALMPFVLGQGVLSLTDALTHRNTAADTRYLAGVLLLLFSAGPINAYGALTDAPLSRLIWIWGVLLLGFATLCYLATVVHKIQTFRASGNAPLSERAEKHLPSTPVLLLTLPAGLLILGQLLYVLLSGHVSLTGDITPETVNSFLQTGGLYRINPLTGSAYTAGVPNRLRFMALPTFYAMLCRVFDLPVDTVVCHIIPAYFLLCGYLAFHVLAKGLFPGGEPSMALRRGLFSVILALLIFATDTGLGLTGYDLLHAGYRETTLQVWILMPALIVFLSRRKWGLALLVLMTEAMTLWTFFGTGAGAVIAVGLFLCDRFLHSRKREEVAA
jgi:hypothetical protein